MCIEMPYLYHLFGVLVHQKHSLYVNVRSSHSKALKEERRKLFALLLCVLVVADVQVLKRRFKATEP